MIQITGLQFSYPNSDFALNIPELKIEQKTCAIIGPSGAGKTTLLKLIAGILQAESGEIFVDGQAMHQLNDTQRREFRRQKLAFIFQEHELIPYLNVLDNVLLSQRIDPKKKISDELQQRALFLLSQYGLEKQSRKAVLQLSEGEKQRVAICRALLGKPQIILADEATARLDRQRRQQVFKELSCSVETQFIMVTHDEELAKEFEQCIDLRDLLAKGE